MNIYFRVEIHNVVGYIFKTQKNIIEHVENTRHVHVENTHNALLVSLQHKYCLQYVQYLVKLGKY